MPQIETSIVSIPCADGKGNMESFYAKPGGGSHAWQRMPSFSVST